MKKVVSNNEKVLFLFLLCISGCNHRSAIYSYKLDIKKHKKQNDKERNCSCHNSCKTILADTGPLFLDQADSTNVVNEASHSITIWIYGTLLLRKSFFYKHFNGEEGLRHARVVGETSKKMGDIACLLSAKDKERFPFDNFYFFGWSGKLDELERERATLCLLNNIKRLIKEHQNKHGITPKITLISHSHGGNIALFMPALISLEEEKPEIDTLILLACPVQRKTMPFIYDSMFKKMYALYSSLDMIQVLAPQHPYYRPFSSKRFPKSEKMTQASVKINGKALLHTSFTKKRFISCLPFVISSLEKLSEDFLDENMMRDKEISLSIKI